MIDHASMLARTRAVIERVAGAARTPPDVGAHTALGDGYWLDSIELLDVIVACEIEFDIVFGDLPPAALSTLGTLTRVIESQLLRTA